MRGTRCDKYVPFKYSDRLGPRDIRLLKLEKDVRATTPRFELVRASLDEDVQYAALSYACGDITTKYKILSGHSFMEIGRNLFDALCRLRVQTPQSLFWVDAISIRQDDAKEKAAQIRMMDDIYRKAQHTYIYLGPGNAHDWPAVQLCMKISSALALNVSKSVLPDINVIQAEHLLVLGLPAQDSVYWDYLKGFFAKDWFFRAWVMQEFILARSCSMLCGLLVIPPHLVFLTAEIYVNNLQHIDLGSASESNTGVMTACAFQHLRRQMRTNYIPLLDLAYLSCRRPATNPKDKLFAYFGLTNDLPETFVDYAKELPELLIEATTLELTKFQSLSWLSRAHHTRRLIGLPSWAPNVTSPALYNEMRLMNDIHLPPPRENNASWFSIINGKVLRVSGTTLATISRVYEPETEPNFEGSMKAARSLASFAFLWLSTVGGLREMLRSFADPPVNALVQDVSKHGERACQKTTHGVDFLLSRLLCFSGIPHPAGGGGTTRDARLEPVPIRLMTDDECFVALQAKNQRAREECRLAIQHVWRQKLWGVASSLRYALIPGFCLAHWFLWDCLPTWTQPLLMPDTIWIGAYIVARWVSEDPSASLPFKALFVTLQAYTSWIISHQLVSLAINLCQQFDIYWSYTTASVSHLRTESHVIDWCETHLYGGRNVFISTDTDLSSRPFVGWCPNDAEPGDMICRLDGLARPFCLRKVNSKSHDQQKHFDAASTTVSVAEGEHQQYVLLGEVFLLDHMDAKTLEEVKSEQQTFDIV